MLLKIDIILFKKFINYFNTFLNVVISICCANSFYIYQIKKVNHDSTMQEEYELLLKEVFPLRQNNEIKRRYQEWVYIGRGSGSEVIKVVDSQSNNSGRAIKKYNKKQLTSTNTLDIIRQVSILQKLATLPQKQNKHFVKLYDKFSICYGGNAIDYGIVLQLCDKSLKDIFDEQDQMKKLTEIQKLQLCVQIAQGINILHQNKIIHRDIKPANILIIYENGKYIPLIADFGHSKQFQQTINIQASMTRMRGTTQYNHPQISNSKNYGVQWDNYQLGIILYQILNEGKFLFPMAGIRSIQAFEEKLKNQLRNLKNLLQKNDKMINPMKSIIQSCLDIKKAKKINLKNIISQMNQIINKIRMQEQNVNIEDKINNIDTITNTTNDKSTQKVYNDNKKVEEQVISIEDEKGQNKEILPISNSLHLKKVVDQAQSPQKYNSLIQIELSQKALKKHQSVQIKISNIKQKQNQKVFTASQNGLQNFPKMLSLQKMIAQKQVLLKQSLIELQKLKVFEQRLASFKIIQQQEIQKSDKTKLLLFCLKHTLMIIKKSKNENKNQFTKKYYQLLYSSLLSQFKKIFLQFKKTNRHLISHDGYSVLQSQSYELSNIATLYKHYVRNSNISVSQMSDVLALLD